MFDGLFPFSVFDKGKTNRCRDRRKKGRRGTGKRRKDTFLLVASNPMEGKNLRRKKGKEEGKSKSDFLLECTILYVKNHEHKDWRRGVVKKGKKGKEFGIH